MSSIRPLATITVLAGVGVFLYMKINETEPIMPAEIAEYNIEELGEIQFGEQATAATEAPAYEAVPDSNNAPAFEPSPPTELAAQPDAAPAYNPGSPVASTAQAAPSASTQDLTLPQTSPPEGASEVGTTTDAGSTNAPDLPPLPQLPPQTTPSSTEAVTQNSNTQAAGDAPGMQSSPQVSSESQSVNSNAPVVSSADEDTQAQQSLFAATRLAVQAALDRGELSQALLLLSDWYGDPSLSANESHEVDELLSQLAGSVIYSTEHRLEPPYMVQEGERLEDIAKKYNIPWQLLAKINGIAHADQLQPGQQIKVVRGPFSAVVDLSKRRMTMMLNRRYAGQFAVDVDPTTTVEEGHWSVNQKLLTPATISSNSPTTPSEERSLMLTNTTGEASQLAIIRAGTPSASSAADPAGRVIRLSSADVEDVYDILSVGSEVVIRR